MFRRIYFSLIAVTTLVCLSCDSVPLLAPSGSTLTIDAQSRVVATGESTQVTATVMESGGTPVHDGTAVRFTTTLGRMEPVEAQTRNGIAVTTFFAGSDSGIAEVKATSGSAGSTTTPPATGGTTSPTNSNVVLISVGAAAIDTVTIRANPAVVPASGGTVTVIATVAGVNGRLLQGIPVNFSATRGTLSSPSAISDTSGNATVTLTTIGDTEVTAAAGSKTSTAVKITALVAPAVTLICSAPAPNTCSGVPHGQTVTFTANRTSGTIVSSTLDFGDGSSVDLGTLSGGGTSGISVPHQYSQPGSYTARLSARDANGETTNAVQVVQVIAVTLTVTTSKSGLTVNATANASSTATTYQWDFGDGFTTTTSVNTAQRTYVLAGTYTIQVTATLQGGGTVSGNTAVTVP